jgi:hypothetical protein
MIRFVYIGDQILDKAKDFAFYDTTTDTFREFGGAYTFTSFENLNELLADDKVDDALTLRLHRLVDMTKIFHTEIEYERTTE